MGPYKCPDCGIWWAGLEHRCRPAEVSVHANPFINVSGTVTVKCNCPPNRGPQYHGTCPIHDIQVTYTAVRRYGVNAIAGPATVMPRGLA